ncbi:MAG: 3-methyladenine DNA glycosylase AlkD [Patiriisocius sp.]|jgi:3-methyladenine DNA glycosylase AlkD
MRFSEQDYIVTLRKEFENNANVERAKTNEQYMRNKFSYYGIRSPLRNEIQKPFLLKSQLPEKDKLARVVKNLWSQEKRDFKYFAIDLCKKYMRDIEPDDIALYEMMISTESWWDTVDLIASTLVGEYLKKYPERRWELVEKWLNSGNLWLQRTSLIFQLKYKDAVDPQILEHAINETNGTKEFFLNKAIGWSLRGYARYEPDWVLDFVENHELSNLSRREALKHLGK